MHWIRNCKCRLSDSHGTSLLIAIRGRQYHILLVDTAKVSNVCENCVFTLNLLWEMQKTKQPYVKLYSPQVRTHVSNCQTTKQQQSTHNANKTNHMLWILTGPEAPEGKVGLRS